MSDHKTVVRQGIAASPGYAVSRAYILKREPYVPERLSVADPAAEQERFREAVAFAVNEIDGIRQAMEEKLGASKAEIFEGHLLLLRDPELLDTILANIGEQRLNAEYALLEVSRMYIEIFEGMDNELLRARAIDIADVSERVMNRLRGLPHVDVSAWTEPCVLIAEELAPSDTARLDPDIVKAIVSEAGSRTSHSAIMARSLDIPAIVGAGPGLTDIPQGAEVVVDALTGELIVHPTEEQKRIFTEKMERYESRRQELRKLKDLPSVTRDGHRVELAANIGKLEDLEKALDNGAEGIGLFRTEFLYMDRSGMPGEDEQFGIYKHALQRMEGKPVVIRTLDIGGDKELPYMSLPKESNPFLGQRAIRLCLAQDEIFRTQLRALLRASAFGNLKIMFPMIAVLEEWRQAKAILLEEKARLIGQGVEVSEELELGMMVEVPAAALLADQFAREVDFFSIGTNDLIQYTMAADRMNEAVSGLYQPCHPAILRLIGMVAEAAGRHGKWVGMCGEMAGDAKAIPLLVGLGLHELSMSAASILAAREAVRGLNRGELVPFAKQALSMGSQVEVEAHLQTLHRS